MALNEQTAIGSILPDVRIKKMIVNDSNDYFLHQRYPHIMHPSEDMPSPDSAGLSTTIVMSMRDTIAHARKSFLFNSLELEKYLMIRVHQFADANASDGGLLTPAAAKSFLNGRDSQGKHTWLKTFVDWGAIANIGGYSYKDLKVQDVIGNKPFKPVPSDNRYFDIPFEITMDSLDGRPANLFFIVHTTLDFEALMDDYDINSNYMDSLAELNGNIKYGIVYENGSIKKTTTNFYAPSGKIWSGPVHYHEASSRYMAGDEHKNTITAESDPDPHFPLIKSTIRNLKVQDMRVGNKVDMFLPNFLYDFKKNVQVPMRTKLLSQDPVNSIYYDPAKKAIDSNGYVSEPFVTHDPLGNPRVFFTLDMLQLARDNFYLGKLLSSCPATGPLNGNRFESWIFENNPIKKIEILRSKVRDGVIVSDEPESIIATAYQMSEDGYDMKSQMQLGWDLLRGDILFWDSDQTAEYTPTVDAVYLVFRNFMKLIIKGEHPSTAAEYTGFRQILPTDEGVIIDASESTRLAGSARKLRSFMFTDLTAKSHPGQSFTYKIRLELKDTTIEATKKLLAMATNSRRFIEEYLELVRIAGSYDQQSHSLTQQFLEEHKDQALIYVDHAEAAFRGMLRFVSATLPASEASVFAMPESGADGPKTLAISESVFESLISYIHPFSATPESIRSFLELYDKFYKIIQDAAGMKNITRSTPTDDNPAGPVKVSSGVGMKDSISLEIQLEKDMSNKLTYVPQKDTDAILRQPAESTLYMDFLGTSLPGGPNFDMTIPENFNMSSPSYKHLYRHIGVPAVGSTGTASEDLLMLDTLDLFSMDRLASLTKYTADHFQEIISIEKQKYFKNSSESYVVKPLGALAVGYDLSYIPDTNANSEVHYFTPTAISKPIPWQRIGGAGSHSDFDGSSLAATGPTRLFTSRTLGTGTTIERATEINFYQTLTKFIEFFHQKINLDEEIYYPTPDAPMLLGAELSSVVVGGEAMPASFMRVRKRLAYILAKIALSLDMSPDLTAASDLAAIYQDMTVPHEFVQGKLTGDEFGSLIENVEAQFLNANSATGTSGLKDAIDLGRLNLLSRIIMCHFIKKMSAGRNIKSIAPAMAQANTVQLISGDDIPTATAKLHSWWSQLPLQIKYIYASAEAASAYAGQPQPGWADHLGGSGKNLGFVEGVNVVEYLRLTNIYKAQYLTGYTAIPAPHSFFSMKEEAFSDLTNDVINTNAGRTLLCRLTKYDNRNLLINLEGHMTFDMFDRYFLVEIPSDYAGTEMVSSVNEDPNEVATVAGQTGDQGPDGGNDDAPPPATEDLPGDENTGGYTT